MSIESFVAIRYDESRVNYRTVVAPHGGELTSGAMGALVEAEPRNIVRLLTPNGGERHRLARAKFFLADWLRAGVLQADEYPAFYFLRETFPPAPGETEPMICDAFFAHVRGHEKVRVLNNETAGRGEADELDAPITALYEDVKGRVGRTFRAEATEREADLRVEFDDRVSELFIIDDETSCARVSEVLRDASLLIVDGVGAFTALPRGFPFLAVLVSTEDARANPRGVHRVFAPGDFDRAEFLTAAEKAFVAEPVPYDRALDEVLADARTAFVLLEHDGHTQFLRPDTDDADNQIGQFLGALRAQPTFDRREAEAGSQNPGTAGLVVPSPRVDASALMGDAAPYLHSAAGAFGPRVYNGFVVAPTAQRNDEAA